ncbi:hypothetical protein EUX98_g7477 [Antrodiella citrinella]|uniref:DJ-1/PfpI domain-containing protein n=1 Tax=Antrodiella citrinella TaxID=2447956 RepID=A0A4V3XHU8_9APHY|nr:hypothetical protein EUX98_g7477 [Antrodiella citrinella]
MSESVQVLKLAVCLFDDVALLDFTGALEQFGFLVPHIALDPKSPFYIASKFAIDPIYLGPTEAPVRPATGPHLVPTRTYGSVQNGEQFDLILVPGGIGSFPDAVPQSLISFLKRQAPGAKYVLSVCTGSWVLAQAGLLQGKRATTNKASFSMIKNATEGQGIAWVPKARWVVDGNYWTSSGVTAGADMGNAFLVHLVGDEATKKIRGVVEISVRDEGDDDFAAFYGLV